MSTTTQVRRAAAQAADVVMCSACKASMIREVSRRVVFPPTAGNLQAVIIFCHACREARQKKLGEARAAWAEHHAAQEAAKAEARAEAEAILAKLKDTLSGRPAKLAWQAEDALAKGDPFKGLRLANRAKAQAEEAAAAHQQPLVVIAQAAPALVPDGRFTRHNGLRLEIIRSAAPATTTPNGNGHGPSEASQEAKAANAAALEQARSGLGQRASATARLEDPEGLLRQVKKSGRAGPAKAPKGKAPRGKGRGNRGDED